MKLCILPIYSLLCGFMGVHVHPCTISSIAKPIVATIGFAMPDTMWLEELSDNYRAAVFVYCNTGNKDIVDVKA